MKKSQSGVSILDLFLIGAFLVVVTVLGMKVGPEYIEYYTILKNVKAVAQDPGLQDASINNVRLAYAKRADIDHSTSVTYQDVVINKDGGGWHLSFAYNKTIPLFANVSLLLEFEGSSDAR